MLSANFWRSQSIRRMLSAFTKKYVYFVCHWRLKRIVKMSLHAPKHDVAQEKGALSNLGNPNYIRSEAAPAPHTTKRRTTRPARANSFHIDAKATKRHVEATGHN